MHAFFGGLSRAEIVFSGPEMLTCDWPFGLIYQRGTSDLRQEMTWALRGAACS